MIKANYFLSASEMLDSLGPKDLEEAAWCTLVCLLGTCAESELVASITCISHCIFLSGLLTDLETGIFTKLQWACSTTSSKEKQPTETALISPLHLKAGRITQHCLFHPSVMMSHGKCIVCLWKYNYFSQLCSPFEYCLALAEEARDCGFFPSNCSWGL